MTVYAKGGVSMYVTAWKARHTPPKGEPHDEGHPAVLEHPLNFSRTAPGEEPLYKGTAFVQLSRGGDNRFDAGLSTKRGPGRPRKIA